MSVHICSECGHESHPFGDGGGAQVAAEFGTQLLGQLPLSPTIRELSDAGQPPLVVDPEGAIAQRYRDAARHLAAQLWQQGQSAGNTGPSISMSDD